MATKNKLVTSGVHIWYRSLRVETWVELGPNKTDAFITANAIGLSFLMLLPAPYNVIATAVASRKLAVVKRNRGPNGIWLKFNPLGFVTARPRTEINKRREPNPW